MLDVHIDKRTLMNKEASPVGVDFLVPLLNVCESLPCVKTHALRKSSTFFHTFHLFFL